MRARRASPVAACPRPAPDPRLGHDQAEPLQPLENLGDRVEQAATDERSAEVPGRARLT